jgi:hypothetical protein
MHMHACCGPLGGSRGPSTGLVGGEIEEPLKSVLRDITKSSARAIILFIDDMHDLVGDPPFVRQRRQARGLVARLGSGDGGQNQRMGFR